MQVCSYPHKYIQEIAPMNLLPVYLISEQREISHLRKISLLQDWFLILWIIQDSVFPFAPHPSAFLLCQFS